MNTQTERGELNGKHVATAEYPVTPRRESTAGVDYSGASGRPGRIGALYQSGLTTVEYAVAGAIVTLALVTAFGGLRDAVLASILRLAKIIGGL